MKYDVVTFGSATLDVFVKAKDFFVKKEKRFTTGKGICFPFPSKVDIDNIFITTGGGGTNAAATLSNQGLKTAFCGKIGEDIAGKEVLKDLKSFGVDTRFILSTDSRPTNSSVIFSAGRDRTVFVFRGASELLKKEEIPLEKLEAKWFYLAPLSGNLAKIFEPLVNFAKENNIKVACNPGNSQVSLKKTKLKSILSKVDVLILNQEEAAFLTKTPYKKEKEVFRKLDNLVPGIAVMTKGKSGVVVSDGKYLFSGSAPNVNVVEKTGAGDAFGSGFVAGFIEKGDVSFAVQLGIANSTACIQKIGAKAGLLQKGRLSQKQKVKIIKKKLS